MSKIKKLLTILILAIISVISFTNINYATNMTSANLYSEGLCPTLLKHNGSDVIVEYVKYKNNGESYPAYCLNKTLKGVSESEKYSVSINKAVTDVGLWRVIINGFPYKTVSELGCATEQEAFTATKHAIYCYIHSDSRVQDYEGVGEAGKRTLKAMKNILNEASKSKETKVSNKVTIKQESDKWTQDETESEYISKYFTVSGDTRIRNYTVELGKIEKDLPIGIKITDRHNEEKNVFSPEQKFKVMIPIKEISQIGSFKINVKTTVKTKPVLYGNAPSKDLQDYAITLASYEDGSGSKTEKYPNNETKIIIEKQDQQTKQKLKGVEFELLNDKKEVIHTGLVTNEKGVIEIENLVPGIYYIKETKTIDDYILNEELTKVEIGFNEIVTVSIDNNKGKQPEIEVEKTKKNIEVKKLPVTGM